MNTADTTTKTASIATAFTRKLYRMLDVEDPAVIGWDATGHSFSIRDDEQLDDHVLPRYFRGRVDVFRQHLSEHGFKTTVILFGAKQVESFAHEFFVRGEPSRLSLIVRVPTNKRRRSRLTKKRTSPGSPALAVLKCEGTSCLLPSFVDCEQFDLCEFLNESTTSFADGSSAQARYDPPSGTDTLHSSLVSVLALHATNPVLSSKAMCDAEDGRPGRPLNFGPVDTPLFSLEMMASMVEWLDTTA